MQVDPIRSTLIAPGADRLKLKYGQPLSNIAFSYNLRRYIEEQQTEHDAQVADLSAQVGRCRLPLSSPR